MNFELLHNGKNIADSIKISKCYSFDRYGGMLDDLTISFATDSHTIEFNENDALEIRAAGGFTTGEMSLDSCIGNDGKFTISAISCRHENKKKKSRIWRQVKLSKIIGDVAENTGLKPLLYGIEDYTYSSVAQIEEKDLQFLSRLLKREGYSLKCDNGNLVVFNEYYLENNSTPITIAKDSIGADYSLRRCDNGLRSMTVRCFNTEINKVISFTSTDSNISGGEDSRIEYLTDISEAQRFSAGYLRDANKYYIQGYLPMPFNGGISAGTVANLTGFEEFDGKYVVYECKQDFLAEKTAVKVRKVLDY